MSRAGFVAKRLAFAVFALYLVLSMTFLFVALTPDPNVAAVEYEAARQSGGDSEAARDAIQAYQEARNRDAPVTERYVRWMVDITTLDWGTSYSQGAPVTDVLANRLPYTALYVLPSLVLSAALGLAIGVYAAVNNGTRRGLLARLSAYAGMSVPNFFLGFVAVFYLVYEWELVGEGVSVSRLEQLSVDSVSGLLDPVLLVYAILPTLVLTTTLVAGQARYARASSMEYVGAEFIKLVRAKGASKTRLAWHVLRNAAIPLFSLFFTELLAVLVLSIYVLESVFGIPGLGAVSLAAIRDRDMPLILGTVLVVVLIGVVGNFLQDVAYASLDPRLRED